MQRTPRGLATLALLKTRFDQGQDHLGLLEPFVIDALRQLTRDDFIASELRAIVLTRSGIDVPTGAIRTVLDRLVRKNLVSRTGGRYVRLVSPESSRFDDERDQIEGKLRELGSAFREFARESDTLLTEDDAIATLAAFVSENKVPLILKEPFTETPLERSTLTRKLLRTVARFITERCLPSPTLRPILESLTEGMTLQDCLLLSDVAMAARRFDHLIVALDTPILFAALGQTGVASAIATKEGLVLLREAGAITVAFDRTVDEVRRILTVYEWHLATAEGRATLHPTALTRYALASHLSPSDVRLLSATVERRLAVIGITVRAAPPRDPRYTGDEQALGRLLDEESDQDETGHRVPKQRVAHDIDCIAAVLTLRGGVHSDSLDHARAVFCSTSGKVIRSVQQWYYGDGEAAGVPPIVHQEALTSIAWLKKPLAVRDIKIHELAALCVVALRPTRETWRRFTENVLRLRKEGVLSDDESVAVVASQMTEPLLARIDEDLEPEADTIVDAIERLRDQYRTQASEEARELILEARTDATLARDAANDAQNQLVDMNHRLDTRAASIANVVSSVFFTVAVLVTFASFVLSIPGVFDDVGESWKLAARIVVAIALCFGLYTQIRGPSLTEMRNRFHVWLVPTIRAILLPPAGTPGADGATGVEAKATDDVPS